MNDNLLIFSLIAVVALTVVAIVAIVFGRDFEGVVKPHEFRFEAKSENTLAKKKGCKEASLKEALRR